METTVVTGMEGLTTAMESVLTMAGTVLTTILGNPVLAFFFGLGAIGSIIAVVRGLRHAGD